MTAMHMLPPHEPATFCTLDRTFTAIAPQLPPSLVPPGALDRVLAVTRQLPAALTRFAYLECRLAANDPQVDVIFDINDEGKLIIAGRNRVIGLPKRLLEHPKWRGIREFCGLWMNPALPLLNAIRSIWLEFDLDGPPSDVPVPGVFVRFEGGTYQETSISESEKLLILRDVVLPVLLDRPVETAMQTHMRRAVEHLPPGAQLTEAGVMLQRSVDSLRLCFRNLPEDHISDYLISIGWDGDLAALSTTLKTFSQPAPPGRTRPMQVGYLDVDVGRAVHGTVGLEYFMETGWQQLVRGVPEKIWLDRLVDAGLCTPEKRDGLLTWPGYSHASFAHEVWPSIVLRHVNHVKLALVPGRALIAKAYLYFFHRYYQRAINGDGSVWKRSSSETSTNRPSLS